METEMPHNTDLRKLLLSEKKTSVKRPQGRPPHLRYRRIRDNFEGIIKARDDERLSDDMAAAKFRFRSAKEFAQAYEAIKDNGQAIIENNDWSGVERVIYAHFPYYLKGPDFLRLLKEFDDPRLPTLTARPESPPVPAVKPPPETLPQVVTVPPPARPEAPRFGKDPTAPAFPKSSRRS